MTMITKKTNAIRILDSHKLGYQVHTYPSDKAFSGVEVAELLDQDSAMTFKTLVTRGRSGGYYVRGGCSPIGMKKPFPLFVEERAKGFDTIIFSGGRIGCQVELSPSDLEKVTSAVFAPLI